MKPIVFPFSRIFIVLTILFVTFFSCGKKTTPNTDSLLLQSITPTLADKIKEQQVFNILLYSYDPDYVQYRLKQKKIVLTNENYQQEFTSLTNIRYYYLYKLQQTYNVNANVIINLIKKDYPKYSQTIDFDNKNVKNERLIAANIVVMECPSGLVFNPAMLMCDFPENVTGGFSTYCMDDETGIISACDGDYDDATKPYRGSIQFQWNGNTKSCSWAQNTPITKTEGIEKLDCAFNKLTSSQKQAFQCTYDYQKNKIQTSSLPVSQGGHRKSVNSCCPNCISSLGNDEGARCDIVINAGLSFQN